MDKVLLGTLLLISAIVGFSISGIVLLLKKWVIRRSMKSARKHALQKIKMDYCSNAIKMLKIVCHALEDSLRKNDKDYSAITTLREFINSTKMDEENPWGENP